MCLLRFCFFFNDTATTEIYTLSLHDALPTFSRPAISLSAAATSSACARLSSAQGPAMIEDRKSTRLNSSHLGISYAVFCLKKKKKKQSDTRWRRGRQNAHMHMFARSKAWT